MMELAGGGPLSDTLYMNVSAESTLSGRRTKLGDVTWKKRRLGGALFLNGTELLLTGGCQWLLTS